MDKNSTVFNYLAECNLYQYTFTLHSFPWYDNATLTNLDILEHVRITVTGIVRIIYKEENRTELCFLESFNVKWKKPSINTDINTQELMLFS